MSIQVLALSKNSVIVLGIVDNLELFVISTSLSIAYNQIMLKLINYACWCARFFDIFVVHFLRRDNSLIMQKLLKFVGQIFGSLFLAREQCLPDC